MADGVHLGVCVHIDREQPEKEQHIRGVRSDCVVREVRVGGVTVRVYGDIQAVIRV